MNTKTVKIRTVKTLTDALRKVKPGKRFNAEKHLGKVKWNEDPLKFQNIKK